MSELLHNSLGLSFIPQIREPAPHSITSSARASSVVGTSRPSALAVPTLTDEFELRGLQDWEVCWLFALENPARINAGFAISVCNVGSVAQETASRDELTIMIDCRNGVAFGPRDQLLPPPVQERIGRDNNRCGLPLCRNRKGEVDLMFTACL